VIARWLSLKRGVCLAALERSSSGDFGYETGGALGAGGDQLVGSPMSLHGDLSCVAYFFSRWPPKAERVDLRPSFSETEKKPATLRLVTALLGLGLK
jgi:hypothetical protein